MHDGRDTTHLLMPTYAELPVPHTRRAALAVVVGMLFIGTFVWLAISNLLHPSSTSWTSLAASMLWLLLVAFVAGGFARGHGGARMLVVCLGHFSMRQFVRIEPVAPGDGEVVYGFRLFRQEFEYLRVALGGVRSVSWSAGQASDMSGRDCDDWTVAIWCDTPAVKTRLGRWDLSDATHVEIIGLSDRKEAAEALGRSLVQALTAAGVVLKPGADARRYDCVGPA